MKLVGLEKGRRSGRRRWCFCHQSPRRLEVGISGFWCWYSSCWELGMVLWRGWKHNLDPIYLDFFKKLALIEILQRLATSQTWQFCWLMMTKPIKGLSLSILGRTKKEAVLISKETMNITSSGDFKFIAISDATQPVDLHVSLCPPKDHIELVLSPFSNYSYGGQAFDRTVKHFILPSKVTQPQQQIPTWLST